MRFPRTMAILLFAAVALFACEKVEPVSTKDPFPMPSGMEESKDLSVEPGDSFFDYCNGSWIKMTPIPATGTVGGMYDQIPAMEQRVEQLKAEDADILRMYELLEADSLHWSLMVSGRLLTISTWNSRNLAPSFCDAAKIM